MVILPSLARACRPLVVAALLAAGGGSAWAAEAERGDFAALRDRAHRMSKARGATAADKTAMVSELAECGTVEAARLIIAVGLAADEAEPRSAARVALARLVADKRIASALLSSYRGEAARSTPLANELAIVLLAAEAGDPRGGMRTMFNRVPPATVLATVAGICAATRRTDDATGVAALRTLTELPCFSVSLACRRGIVATLASLKDPAAIEALVDMMSSLRGEARGDAIAHLARVSGERHGTDAKAWRAWLDASRAAGAPAAANVRPAETPPEQAAAPDSQAAYYDIPIYADRVVFVIDTSGSMQGPRLETAKRELQSAIFTLPETTLFAVLFFNSRVGPWQPQFVPATDANKRAAAAFVSQLPPVGRTATSDAFEAAFTFDAEAIFFLSDGEPSAGRVTDPAGILELVARLNAGRAVSVNTISIMGGAAFLENLARANQGSFRAVDE